MPEIFNLLQKKYFEEIASKIPLHNFLILLFFLLVSDLRKYNDSERIIDGLDDVNITYIFNVKKGLLASISLKEFLIAIFLTCMVKLAHYVLKYSFWKIIYKVIAEKIEENITKLKNNSKNTENEFINKIILDQSSDEYTKNQKTFTKLNQVDEFFLAVFIAFIVNFQFSYNIDIVVIVTSILSSIIMQYKILSFYISDMMVYVINLKFLQNKKFYFGDK